VAAAGAPYGSTALWIGLGAAVLIFFFVLRK
jgi:hypothetical protein